MPPVMFRLRTWMRAATDEDFDLRSVQRNVQYLDYSLDIRKSWSSMAHVSMDTAYATADNLYNQLTGLAASMAASGNQDQWLQGGTAQAPGHRPDHFLHRRPLVKPLVPAILVGADMSQAVLIMSALAFMHQRLSEGVQPYALAVTVMSNKVLPRIDGRNGFVFKLELHSFDEVDQYLQGPKPMLRKPSEQRVFEGSREDTRPARPQSSPVRHPQPYRPSEPQAGEPGQQGRRPARSQSSPTQSSRPARIQPGQDDHRFPSRSSTRPQTSGPARSQPNVPGQIDST